jgi:hypothetical protein
MKIIVPSAGSMPDQRTWEAMLDWFKSKFTFGEPSTNYIKYF